VLNCPARSLNLVVMRLVSALPLFVSLIVSCATEPALESAQRCSLASPEAWSRLPKAPPQKAQVLAELRKTASYGHSVLEKPGGRALWFEGANGTRVAYCYLPEYPSVCNNFTATFEMQSGSWRQTAEEQEVVVCAS
jgi:hypothetical protein